MKLAIFTDYDGTITIQDTVDLVLDTFGAADWRDTSARIDATGAGDIERMAAEFVGLATSIENVREFIRENVTIDETFVDFLAHCRSRGWEVVVLSQGMGESVEEMFAKYGIDGVEWHANALGGEDGDLRIEFPERGTVVDEFYRDREGVYKPGYIRRAAREGSHVDAGGAVCRVGCRAAVDGQGRRRTRLTCERDVLLVVDVPDVVAVPRGVRVC